MKIVYDTNVVLDVLLQRKPFESDAIRLMSLAEDKTISGFLCATTVTTINYVVARHHNKAEALANVNTLLRIFDVSPVNHSILDRAAQSKFTDFEDAVLYESAKLAGADAIVTRNGRDFKAAKLPIYTPHEILAILTQSPSEDEC